ncbi:MAG: pre-toxin TG domain-containing protein [Lachnospiraceae bacterium]|nr:pre-toxin TG domain-containing protein [Lachnospiraceae bacterium]
MLDITIAKPVIECITGVDLITGECLTDFEMGMKFAGAMVDIFTLGQAMVLTKGAGLGVSAVIKTIGLELLSNASAYTVGYAGDAMGAPLPSHGS